MQKTYYSNGKLLLSGEYAILDGAVGLSIPTKYGQSLEVIETASGLLEWKSFDENGAVWFEGNYNLDSLTELSSADPSISKTLMGLLAEAKAQNPKFLVASSGHRVETKLNFPRSWGLGTSSTLINNMAQWAEIDAYQLLQNAFGGSGYDIACAKHNHPILYQLNGTTPKVEEIHFDPPFKTSIFFVYLNQKKSSKEAIANYRKKAFDGEQLIADISSITESMVNASTLTDFESLMTEHEEILSKILGIPPVKAKLFSDYPGAIKSLGGWGGDFVMATGTAKDMGYFKSKGYKTIVPYIQMGHPSIG